MTQVGAVVGVQVMQGVQQATAPTAGPIASYGYAYHVGAGVALLGAVVGLAVRASDRSPADDAEAALAVP
jgi:hypothetical protein